MDLKAMNATLRRHAHRSHVKEIDEFCLDAENRIKYAAGTLAEIAALVGRLTREQLDRAYDAALDAGAVWIEWRDVADQCAARTYQEPTNHIEMVQPTYQAAMADYEQICKWARLVKRPIDSIVTVPIEGAT